MEAKGGRPAPFLPRGTGHNSLVTVPNPEPKGPAGAPPPPSSSSLRQLGWLALGLAAFLVVIWLLLGPAWQHVFEDR